MCFPTSSSVLDFFRWMNCWADTKSSRGFLRAVINNVGVSIWRWKPDHHEDVYRCEGMRAEGGHGQVGLNSLCEKQKCISIEQGVWKTLFCSRPHEILSREKQHDARRNVHEANSTSPIVKGERYLVLILVKTWYTYTYKYIGNGRRCSHCHTWT